MKPLSFIPGHPGTKTTYLRASCARRSWHSTIAASSRMTSRACDRLGRTQTSRRLGAPLLSGVSFYDVSDPRNPKVAGRLAQSRRPHPWHGDGRQLRLCMRHRGGIQEGGPGRGAQHSQLRHAFKAQLAPRFHITGSMQVRNSAKPIARIPNGSDQMITCHEISKRWRPALPRISR